MDNMEDFEPYELTHREFIKMLHEKLHERCDGDLLDIADILGIEAQVHIHGIFKVINEY